MTPPDGDGSGLPEARRLLEAFRWRQCVDLLTDVDARDGLDGEALLLPADRWAGRDVRRIAAHIASRARRP